MRSRAALSMALAATVLSSAAPLPSAPPASPARPDKASPVRCSDGGPNERGRGYGGFGSFAGNRVGATTSAPPSPPPPVAMPSMPSPVMAEARDATVAARRAPPPSAAKMMAPGIVAPRILRQEDRERYAGREVAAIKAVQQEPVSTFSVDVDTGSYANVRRFLTDGAMPPQAAVRTEEMLNYFRYDYPAPADRSRPFSVTADMSTTPWNTDTRVLRVGIRGYDTSANERPPANLVFLVDVSGSMDSPDKLPLLKSTLMLLADKLSPRDHVSIVVYAGAAGVVLEPTNEPRYIKAAIDCLSAGGSTAGGQGIQLAYSIARAHRIPGGINRIILGTDGDFNVGVTDNAALEDMVERNREDGITLTTLGFGTGNYNEAMMERIADVGNGNYAYIDSAIEARKVLDDELSSTLFTIAKDVKIQIEFNPAWVSEYRLIGYENRALAEEDFDNDKVDAGDIGAGHQVTALYEIVPAGTKGWLPERRYDANQRPAGAGPANELAWLKLRYKLPDGQTSMLIERPVAAGLVRTATAPRGDMAFACAVAAFGQKLRGDKYLGGFSYADARRLAGSQSNYYRQEFLKLTQLAEAKTPGGAQGGLD